MADEKGLTPYSNNHQLTPKQQSNAEAWLEGQSASARRALSERWQLERETTSSIAALYAHNAQRYRQVQDIRWGERETIDHPDQRAEYDGYLAVSGESLTTKMIRAAESGSDNLLHIRDSFDFIPPPPRSLKDRLKRK